ncbi:MAG: M14 family metallopeptidase [Bacillota bacterium]|nr:M14 family metallopeptidase [Bacillota bacterium]
MPELFKVGNLTCGPNSKARGFLKVANAEIEMPITLVSGSPGKTVVITGGTHGGEYPGIETAIRLAQEIGPQDVKGNLAIVHPVNTTSFLARTQYYVPADGKNLNRMFPGRALGTLSERIAYTISTELFSQADFYMDLHGGDIHEALIPFVLYPAFAAPDVARVSREAASKVGVRFVVGSYSSNGSIGSAAVAGVPGMLVEIGQCGLWSEEEVSAYARGVRSVLRHLGMLGGMCEDLGPVEYVERMNVLVAEHEGCWYPRVKPGDSIESGQEFGQIRDYFGKVLGKVCAPSSGIVLYVARSLAILPGDPIGAIG